MTWSAPRLRTRSAFGDAGHLVADVQRGDGRPGRLDSPGDLPARHAHQASSQPASRLSRQPMAECPMTPLISEIEEYRCGLPLGLISPRTFHAINISTT